MIVAKFRNFCLISLAVLAPLPALAATITVNTFEDNFAQDALCSLREAVASANSDQAVGGCDAGSGADEIILSEGTYIISRSCYFNNDEVAAQFYDYGVECDDLDVSDDVTVKGAGKDITIIKVDPQDLGEQGFSGFDGFRAFDVKAAKEIDESKQVECAEGCQPGITLALQDLTVQDGAAYNGGAVRVSSPDLCAPAKLSTSNVVFASNHAFSGGGAVYVKGQLTASDTTFADNTAFLRGGGAYLDWSKSCELTSSIVNSTFSNNKAFKGSGGGLFLDRNSAANIAGSGFTGNNASESGAAIAGQVTDLSVTNCTITGNGLLQEIQQGGLEPIQHSPIFGGGISIGRFDFYSDGADYEPPQSTLLIADSTIAENNALVGGGGVATLGNFTTFVNGEGYRGFENVTSTIRGSAIDDNEVQADYFQLSSEDTVAYFVLFSQSTGGGILNGAFGKMTIEQSTVDGNTASIGAGISNTFQLALVRSSVTNNTALVNIPSLPASTNLGAQEEEQTFFFSIGFSGGGGVFNSGAADIDSSTISGNATDGSGAGLLNVLSVQYASLYSYQNEVPEGADLSEIALAEPGTRLNNVTVSNNSIAPLETPILVPLSADTSQVGVYINNGGGIATFRGGIYVANSIVAGNQDDQELLSDGDIFPNAAISSGISLDSADPDAVALFGNFAPDCFAFPADAQNCITEESGPCAYFEPLIESAQYNIIGNNLGCTPFQPAENSNNDQVGTENSPIDPLLDTLQSDGTTSSQIPLKGSPAIDKGNPADAQDLIIDAIAAKPCSLKDQKNRNRSLDGTLSGIKRCDVGAIEAVVDCNGDPKGTAVLDVCGVCGGDGSSCAPVVPTPNPQELTCKEQDITATLFVMDGSSNKLANLTKSIAGRFNRAGGSKKTASAAVEKAKKLHNVSWTATWSLPTVIKSDCTGTLSTSCVAVSNAAFANDYSNNVGELSALNQSLIKKLKRLKVKKSVIKKYTKRNDSAYATALGSVASVPAASTACP